MSFGLKQKNGEENGIIFSKKSKTVQNGRNGIRKAIRRFSYGSFCYGRSKVA